MLASFPIGLFFHCLHDIACLPGCHWAHDTWHCLAGTGCLTPGIAWLSLGAGTATLADTD